MNFKYVNKKYRPIPFWSGNENWVVLLTRRKIEK